MPTFSKFEGSTVSGIESIFVDPRAASPFETAVSFIVKSKQLYGEGVNPCSFLNKCEFIIHLGLSVYSLFRLPRWHSKAQAGDFER